MYAFSFTYVSIFRKIFAHFRFEPSHHRVFWPIRRV